MYRRMMAACCVAVVLAFPASGETFSEELGENVRLLNKMTSSISDRFLFNPVNEARARISDGMVSRAEKADRYLEAEGWTMPDANQQTGPVEAAASWLADVSCGFGDMTLGTAQSMRDGVKEMAATGIENVAQLGEGVYAFVTR